MSHIAKAMMLIPTALIAMSFAAAAPNWDAELIFDDFNDLYGDPINRTCLGAIKSYGDNPGSYTKGKAGYWYTYSATTASVSNPGGVAITEANIATAFDAEAKCMHAKFVIAANEDYCAIAASLTGEKIYVDLSKLTSISLRVKGTGFMRMYLASKYIATKYTWGELGAEIKLTSAWTDVNIPVAKLVPAPYSDAETDAVTWADCKTGIAALAFEASANADGDKEDTEFFIDSIVFKGMKYSDVVTPVSVQSSARPANLGTHFSIANNAISYTIAQPGKVSFSIVDMKGSVVSQINGNGISGSNTITLPALTAGNYLVKMNGTNKTQQFSIVK